MTNDTVKCLETLTQLARTHAPLRSLWEQGATRVSSMSYHIGKIYVDLSKQSIDGHAHKALLSWAESVDIESARHRLVGGECVNKSENRPALHMALRGDIGPQYAVQAAANVQKKMQNFCQGIRQKNKIRNIVHIGIGGSDLGVRLCAQAFALTARADFELRFASNVDASSITAALSGLKPEETLIIIASKSFGTQETLVNGSIAKRWLENALGVQAAQHIVAVCANQKAAVEFGILDENIFALWDWVGGRYSLWSAVGLCLMLCYGEDVFSQLLAGAHAMDKHFIDAPMAENLPIMLGLVGMWNCHFLDLPTQGIFTYNSALALFPSFLQQLEMESNGKSVTETGAPALLHTPIVWGGEGTNVQHSVFQYLHQGKTRTAIDFVVCAQNTHEDYPDQHKILLAHAVAQAEGLMKGQKFSSDGDKRVLSPHKVCQGNRPSSFIILDDSSPYAIGQLLALYEHKTFVMSVLCHINAFDQWGVEIGKGLAKTIYTELQSTAVHAENETHDASTQSIIEYLRAKWLTK